MIFSPSIPSFDFNLTNELVSSDILTVFFTAITNGIILGIAISLMYKATWWLWD